MTRRILTLLVHDWRAIVAIGLFGWAVLAAGLAGMRRQRREADTVEAHAAHIAKIRTAEMSVELTGDIPKVVPAPAEAAPAPVRVQPRRLQETVSHRRATHTIRDRRADRIEVEAQWWQARFGTGEYATVPA